MKKLLLIAFSLLSLFSYGQQSDAANTSQFNVIRNEQSAGGNTRQRVADAYEALNGSKVNRADLVIATGTNDYSVQASTAIVDYSKPIQLLVKFNNQNSGACTINVNHVGPVALKKNVSVDLVSGDITTGQIAWIVYDGTQFQFISLSSSAGSNTFGSDIVVSLSGGKTLGPFSNGDTIPTAGKTSEQAFNLIAIEYQNPQWNSFSVSGTGIAPTVEVNTSMPATGTFTWSISVNSGVVSTIDLVDVTASTTLQAGVLNTGSASHSLTSKKLTSNGATQSWRGILHDTGAVTQDINSTLYTVIGRYFRFYGPNASSVTNSATVRGLANHTDFQLAGAVFNLLTGTTQTKFIVCLPPGITIQTVIDLDGFNADITSQYTHLSNINVLTADGSTNAAYNIYEMNIGATYSTSHRHQITTN